VYKKLAKWLPEATQLIENSFLKPNKKKAYKELITGRVKVFGLVIRKV
jgi:serine/threonine-protein kinase HipA